MKKALQIVEKTLESIWGGKKEDYKFAPAEQASSASLYLSELPGVV